MRSAIRPPIETVVSRKVYPDHGCIGKEPACSIIVINGILKNKQTPEGRLLPSAYFFES